MTTSSLSSSLVVMRPPPAEAILVEGHTSGTSVPVLCAAPTAEPVIPTASAVVVVSTLGLVLGVGVPSLPTTLATDAWGS
jgi:hypothetical protein